MSFQSPENTTLVTPSLSKLVANVDSKSRFSGNFSCVGIHQLNSLIKQQTRAWMLPTESCQKELLQVRQPGMAGDPHAGGQAGEVPSLPSRPSIPAEMGISVGRVQEGVGSEHPSSSSPRLVAHKAFNPSCLSRLSHSDSWSSELPLLSSRRGAQLLPALPSQPM